MDPTQAVATICLALPDSEAFVSHGAPSYRVRKGKVFAMLALNHHGDGRAALWVNAPPGAQLALVETDPKYFFVPPYLGPRGWVAIRIDLDLPWTRIAELVREAYKNTAPSKLWPLIPNELPIIKANKTIATDALNPLASRAAKAAIKKLDKICQAFPETVQGETYGSPVWQAGKKSFAAIFEFAGELHFSFRPTASTQALLALDPRWKAPPYWGARGWMSLPIRSKASDEELQQLALESYREVALKRMLAKL